MDGVQRWCRVTVVGPDGTELAHVVLEGPGAPDLAAVDDVARLALAAGRLGGEITLLDLSPALGALLELAGLRVEMEGQAELEEEPVRVQEGQEPTHPGDLAP
jgi:hypothetical protein